MLVQNMLETRREAIKDFHKTEQCWYFVPLYDSGLQSIRYSDVMSGADL